MTGAIIFGEGFAFSHAPLDRLVHPRRLCLARSQLLGELLLNGNEIGKTGATKLIQYAAYHP